MTETLYIFDEPTIGLHPHDIQRLNKTLTKLRDVIRGLRKQPPRKLPLP
jgi:excinuclease UvrABC ATPase subunit